MIPFAELIRRHNLKITGVIHCGANLAQEKELYDQLIDGEVLWIEALPDVFERMKIMIQPFHRQTAIKACLSNVDGKTVAFNISSNDAQSSSYLEFGEHLKIHPDVSFVDCVALKTMRLDTLFNLLERDISKINFLNLDLQGAELDALQGAGKILNQIDYILTECNNKRTYVGCPLVTDLDDFLSDFHRVETGEWVGECWTDCLYVRKSLL